MYALQGLRARCPHHAHCCRSLITTSSSSSDKMGSNVELDIGADISDERHCKNQEVRNSTNCGLKRKRQREISPYSHSRQPTKCEDFEVEKVKSWTDEMFDFINKEIAFYKSDVKKKETSNASGIQHCTGQPLDQDGLKSSKGTELFPSSNKNYDTSASENCLKGTLI